MKNTTEKEILVNGNSFHVEITGQGTPLVLIMGLGAPGEKWNQNVKVYSQHFQCITIDNRGVGLSDKPKADSYSTIEMAQDVLGIMDALGIQQAHINGVSMGGAIAQHLAAGYPRRVGSLVLTSTFASVSNSFRRAIEVLRDSVELLDKATFKHLNQWMTFSQGIQNTNEEMLWEAERQDALYPYPMPAYAYRAQCNACLAHDATLELRRITSPTLIAAGSRDLFVPIEKTMELYEGIAASELYLCKNGGHVHQWEQPEAYNRATLDFFLRHDQ